MTKDRFGNEYAPGVPYARGEILSSTSDDLAKLRAAWALIRGREARGEATVNASGLERCMSVEPGEERLLDDELAAALLTDELKELGLKMFGGDADRHDVMVTNRLTAGLLVAADVVVPEGSRVIGFSPTYSHPAVQRAVKHARATFTDLTDIEELEAALAADPKPGALFLTRLAVSYQILDEADLRRAVDLAHGRGIPVIVDDAGGARVGPACFGHPRTLELPVAVACTGLDKYGTLGPRLGLIGGDKDVVARMRARAYEMGIEARAMLYPQVVRSLKYYSDDKVRDLVDCTMTVRDAVVERLGADRVHVTPVTAQLKAEDILEMAMARSGINEAPRSSYPCVPYEATAALAMLLLRDHGILTVHFAGIPPGTSALMLKFISPEVLEAVGGAAAFAEAVDASIGRLGEIIADKGALTRLLKGAEAAVPRVAAE
ncbi:MAG: hypothetical protein COW30_18750 [Rhodospirillales bacterium CG15_BIG_FIL_POST_REV_8_21_14_020_66_15]|nr:MAG: hypothetical protein COW30_18750 [Rhodospirillales bacterium CG15_BIG_FIL_POST_REV_8_21_14_020_66_15]